MFTVAVTVNAIVSFGCKAHWQVTGPAILNVTGAEISPGLIACWNHAVLEPPCGIGQCCWLSELPKEMLVPKESEVGGTIEKVDVPSPTGPIMIGVQTRITP